MPDHSPPESEIRDALPSDLPRLPAIERRADRMLVAAGICLDLAPASGKELRAARHILVTGRPPIGFARIEEHGGEAHLEQLSVDPDRAREGRGGRLLEAACAWAAAAGYREMTLVTFRDVAFNGPFYARHGFSEIAAPPRLAGVLAEDRRLGLHRYGPRVVMRRAL